MKKTIYLIFACFAMLGCSTPQEAADYPPQLRAVITRYDSTGATVQCVLDTSKYHDNAWDSSSVRKITTGEKLMHTVSHKMKNIALNTQTSTQDSYPLIGLKNESKGSSDSYFSSAQIHIEGFKRGDTALFTVVVDGVKVECEIR